MRYLDDIDNKLREIQDSSNPIKEILDANDESDLINNKIRYIIHCKPCNLYNVINNFFKRVPGFRIVISTSNMLVVDNFRTKEYDVRQILCSWIRNRLIEKRAWFLRRLVSTTTEYNMLEGKSFMLSPENLNKTINIFRSCEARDEIVPSIVKAYNGKVTSSQANYVSELRVYNLTNGEYKKTIKAMESVQKDIDYIRNIIETPNKVEVIIDDKKQSSIYMALHEKSKILNLDSNEKCE